jgi:hypothetical protein
VWSYGEDAVVHAGDGLDGEDLLVLHPADDVLDAGTDLAVRSTVLLLAPEQPASEALRCGTASTPDACPRAPNTVTDLNEAAVHGLKREQRA